MARIQILELPFSTDGDVVRERFALVVDSCDDVSLQNCAGETVDKIVSFDQLALEAFAREIGAVGLLVVSDEIEVA